MYIQFGNERHQWPGVIEDYAQVEACFQHPLFSIHKEALQILFYFNKLEVCNPLGSKTKTHKLGM